jgi:hypothetical protein
MRGLIKETLPIWSTHQYLDLAVASDGFSIHALSISATQSVSREVQNPHSILLIYSATFFLDIYTITLAATVVFFAPMPPGEETWSVMYQCRPITTRSERTPNTR